MELALRLAEIALYGEETVLVEGDLGDFRHVGADWTPRVIAGRIAHLHFDRRIALGDILHAPDDLRHSGGGETASSGLGPARGEVFRANSASGIEGRVRSVQLSVKGRSVLWRRLGVMMQVVVCCLASKCRR